MQSETVKHTPGPHVVTPHGNGSFVHGINGVGIAWFGANSSYGADGGYHITAGEAKVNAHLFAHAGQLLSIVERLAGLRDGLDNGNSSAEHAASLLAAESQQLLSELREAAK